MVLQKFNELSGTIGECMFQYYHPVIYFKCTDNQWPKFGRGMSTIHAVFITAMSLYFVFWSDLFSDHQHTGIVTLRSSQFSIVGLGVSSFLALLWWYLMTSHLWSIPLISNLSFFLPPPFFFLRWSLISWDLKTVLWVWTTQLLVQYVCLSC